MAAIRLAESYEALHSLHPLQALHSLLPLPSVSIPPFYPPCNTCNAVTVVVMAGNERTSSSCRQATKGGSFRYTPRPIDYAGENGGGAEGDLSRRRRA